ncbi:septal ring lytic transglycosylase RlpA family protein [Epilithonimonas sp.]|uniref:septal ring lytic transglycosylase RlpA family protein n=1 Tax=Epilithonimonas sp. TaxID=2894511 RepID=UPI00289F0ABD|nr:septal ring lytic transglycosylase RlpA family protein [Epilithonimonas sp.]
MFFFIYACGSRSPHQGGYRTTTVSFYANKFNGKRTASGEIFSNSKLTGAHRSLPFGSKVEMINTANEKSVIVEINDRGALKGSREFDISQKAFKKIANLEDGVVKIKYRLLN